MPSGHDERKRAGSGEYVFVGTNAVVRTTFLNTVFTHARFVFDELLALKGHVSTEDFDPLTGETRVLLLAWAYKWGLTDQWALDMARATLAWHIDNPDDPPSWWHGVRSDGGWIPTAWPTLTWDPMKDREDVFKRQRVKAYIAEVRAFAESNGFIRTPQKPQLFQHCRWVVHYQIERLSYADIEARYGNDDHDRISTIEKAVRSTARLAGLTLRK
ncbi:MAG: hypothetical protein ABJA98_22075 [Acidobacteriota bacterium]